MSFFWPKDILKPQSFAIDINHRSLRGPTSASGFTQVISNSAGIWKASFSDIPVYSQSMIKLWRAIDALAEGQLNPFYIPCWEFRRAPLPTGVTEITEQETPHDDDVLFEDDTPYVGNINDLTVLEGAVSGSTTIKLLKVTDALIEPPNRFSINGRLYQITRIIEQTETEVSVNILPPLREPLLIGDIAEFDFPWLRVRLASDNEMNLPLNFDHDSFPTVNFIEDL